MGWRWGDLTGACLLGGIFLLILIASETWKRLASPNPEWTRKLVHVGGGMACLLFPFLIESPWIVLLMASLLSAFFALGAGMGFLESLHGVSRSSRGSEYYPLAIFLLFLMAHDRYWLYLSSVLTLAVSDAFAALIGSKYGVIRYEVEDEQKSLEGSLVFLVLTFLAIHLPTLLMTNYPRPICVLSALLVAVLVTGFEAISLRGSDNLFIPVAVCVVLSKIVLKPLDEVIYQNLSLLGICVVIGFSAWRGGAFNVGGKLVFMLFAYGTWSLGSWQWALPVFLGFFAYLLLGLLVPAPQGHVSRVKVRVLTRILLPPFFFLILANSSARYDFWYGPYMAACAAILTLSLWGYIRWRHSLSDLERRVGAMATGLLGWVAVTVVPWRLQSAGTNAFLAVAGMSLVVGLIDDLLMGRDPSFEPDQLWNAHKFVLPFFAASVISLLQWTEIIPMWQPV